MMKRDWIFVIAIGLVLTIGLPLGVNDMLWKQDKVDEIPQYNCYILNSEMKKWSSEPFIYNALQKEWFVKECWGLQSNPNVMGDKHE